MRFDALVGAAAPAEIHPGIAELLERKRVTEELGLGEPIPELGRFIEAELERHGDAFSGLGRPDLVGSEEVRVALNRVFREAIPTVASATGLP